MYNFMFNGTFSVNFSVSTAPDAPEGFGEDKIRVTSTLTTLTVNWEEPDMLNGPLDNVTISIATAGQQSSRSRKRRSTGQFFDSNEMSGTVLFNNLLISTDYTVQVTVTNRYDVIWLILMTSINCIFVVFHSVGSISNSTSHSTGKFNKYACIVNMLVKYQ